MDATARIENLPEGLGLPQLASKDALKCVEGEEVRARKGLGVQSRRGNDSAVRVYAASPAAIQ